MNLAAPLVSAPQATAVSDHRRWGRNSLLAGGDLVALAVASTLAGIIAPAITPATWNAPPWLALALILGVIPFWLGVFAVYGLYDNDIRKVAVTSIDEAHSIFHALLVGSLGILLLDQGLRRLTDWRISSAIESVTFVCLALATVIVVRGALRSWVFTRIFRRRRALLVGDGPDARFFERTIAANPELGIDIVGAIGDDERADGRTEELAATIARLGVDRIVLTSDGGVQAEILALLRSARRPDVQISILPRYYEVFTSHALLEEIAGAPIVTLPDTRLKRSSWVVKRAFDIVVSATALVVLSPMLLVTAAAIRLDSRGPVVYRQARRGRGGSQFEIAKFRTMYTDAERHRDALLHLNQVDGPLFKIKGADPRITRVGGFLRRWSLDELPQLWNVLRGEMSLVGPRPFVIHEADLITGWAQRRLDITPGITGPWQVHGRNDLSFAEMVRLDYVYATNWSLWWDLRILYRTVLVVLKRKGAY